MKSPTPRMFRAIRLSKATVRKMKQNLFVGQRSIMSSLSPLAAGVLYPSLGLMLRPEFGAPHVVVVDHRRAQCSVAPARENLTRG